MSDRGKDNPPPSSRRTQSYRTAQEADPVRRNLVKGLAIGAGLVATGGIATLVLLLQTNQQSKSESSATSASPEKPTTLKDRILSFTWIDAENPERLTSFVDALADKYLELTKTTRVTKRDLTGPAYLSFHNSSEEFMSAIRAVQPDFIEATDQFGFTHYETNRMFIDLSRLKFLVSEQAKVIGLEENRTAGLALLDALWHEWGHRDVTPRTTGSFINNPQAAFHSPVSNQNEVIRRFRGGAAYTDTYYGYLTFDEVWNESINVRRMVESLGLEQIISARNYYQNGIDFFPALTAKMGIPLDTVYEMHATSDFEGFAKLIGENLPENSSPEIKGVALFTAIHQSSAAAIRQTGALALLNR